LHPQMPVIDSNIGLMLHAAGEYDKSLLYLDSALQLNKEFFGVKSLKVALAHHLLARTHSCLGDFRTALHCEKECFAIYREKLGIDNERTRESSECLNHLTQQAVVFQRKVNELSSGHAKHSLFPPIQIQTPSMSNILETLNVVNGIFFIQLSGDDMERLCAQMTGAEVAPAAADRVAAASIDAAPAGDDDNKIASKDSSSLAEAEQLASPQAVDR